ncbi:MAG: hypothetical protein CW716_11925 [Candidatus Bathyarchaeum sp.]|nr:MAG: hypothetical protein CW716_11925 [Candidatus Bathyarchaeum sp.]
MAKNSFICLVCLVLVLSTFGIIQAQTSPSVRYLGLENKNGSECTVLWSVFHVSEWADKIHFRLWVIRDGETIPVGIWEIGLSEKIDQGSAQIMPGFGIQGLYGDNVSISQATAEAPFATEQMTHPIDGLQTYYFYKTHVTFDFTFQNDDILVLAADYKNGPDYYDGALPYYGLYNTGDYYKIEYNSIPDEAVFPPLVVNITFSPSTPYVDTEITFVASSSSGYSDTTNYIWDFGDNNVTSVSTTTVTHKYLESGVYNVVLTIINETAGTNNASTTVTVLRDDAPPVTVAHYNDTWHTTDVNIPLTATDQQSGVAETYYQINGGTVMAVSTDGQPLIVTEGSNNRLDYWSVDNSGKQETTKVITGIKLDKMPPVSSISFSTSTGNGDWFTSDVTVTVSATDAISEADKIQYSLDNQVWNNYSSPFTIVDEGEFSIYYRSTDEAGNVETTKTETVKLDKTPPQGSVVINEDAVYANSVSVTLTLTADDPVSGITQMRFSNDGTSWSVWEAFLASKTWKLPEDNDNNTVYVQFKNNADLVSEIYQDSITVDAKKPTANAGLNRTVNPNEPIKFNAKKSKDNTVLVRYEWNFGDGATGEGKTVTHQYTNSGKYKVTLTVHDTVGNTDTTQITVTVKAPEESPLGLIVTVTTVTIIVVALSWFTWKKRKTSSR